MLFSSLLGVRVSTIRLSLLIAVFIGQLIGATSPDHPLYFEERSS